MRVNDVELEIKRHKSFYRYLQMVFQDPFGSLHPRHTVNDILAEPLKIHGFNTREKRILQALDEVGLRIEHRFRFPHQLSGGQRQRLAIARALILKPQVILLDEPTSSLDVSVQAEILNLLQRLRSKHNLTFILVSHNLSVVGHMCDRLLVMNAGQQVEELTIEQLRNKSVRDPYTKQLLLASIGYNRSVIKQIAWFD